MSLSPAPSEEFQNEASLQESGEKKRHLSKQNLSHQDLSYQDLSGSTVIESNLIGTILKGASLQEAFCQLTTFSSKTDLSLSNLDSAEFNQNLFFKVDFSNCSGVSAGFNDCKMLGCIIANANMEFAEFDNCILNNTNFSGSILNNSIFQTCAMQSLNLSNTCLTGAKFSNSDIDSSNFTNAVLFKAKFSDVSLSNTNFSNANLCGAIFEKVEFAGALFVGVIEATLSKDRYEDMPDYNSLCNLRGNKEEIYKETIEGGVKSILYLLSDDVLTDYQLRQMLGSISEENSKSSSHNFLSNFDYQFDEEENRQQIMTLISRVEEIEKRLKEIKEPKIDDLIEESSQELGKKRKDPPQPSNSSVFTSIKKLKSERTL